VIKELVSLDSKIIPSPDSSIGAFSSAALYGKGVFTSLAIHDAKPFLWEKHWRRLTHDAGVLGIDLMEFSEESVRRAFDEIVKANSVVYGRTRITFFDESPSSVWHFDAPKRTSVLIMTGDRKSIPGNFRIEMSSFRISSVSKTPGIKSCNYLDNLLAHEEATRHGFHEAIRLNERGEATSGCMANVFWLEGEKLVTPSLTTGCLAGTTREFVLENIACEEVESGQDRIDHAGAIFLTSAGLGVVRVSELNGRKLGGENHPILELVPGNPS